MPKVPITIYSDRKIPGPFQVRLFKASKNKELWLDRLDCLSQMPFSYNLYMDADMRVYDDLADMFELLDKFDIAVNHADNLLRQNCPVKDIPAAFPTLAAGVMLFRRSTKMAKFFAEWRKVLIRHIEDFPKCVSRKPPYHHNDQEALRVALWRSDLKMYILPPEWGFHGYAGYLRDKVRIMQISYGAEGKIVNEHANEPRVYVNLKIFKNE